ncbi:MAG: hypothetical protein KAU20_07900 [Nanoarchaeota archaeon]|nr:hypothetical protein [Nanoarchaeota archaeon]
MKEKTKKIMKCIWKLSIMFCAVWITLIGFVSALMIWFIFETKVDIFAVITAICMLNIIVFMSWIYQKRLNKKHKGAEN